MSFKPIETLALMLIAATASATDGQIPRNVDWIGLLLGPTGGVFAIGALFGCAVTWTLNLKIVSPFVQRAHAAEMAAMLAKITALEARVKELESFEARYMKLLEMHSERTLRVPNEL